MNKVVKVINHIKNGNIKYVFNKFFGIIFPVPNHLLYWGSTIMMKGMYIKKTIPKRKNDSLIKVRIATENDIKRLLKQFSCHSYNASRINVATCFIAINQETKQIVAYSWIKISSKPFVSNSGMIVNFTDNIAGWAYGFYVRPEYRLGSVFLRLTQLMRDFSLKQKCITIYSETNIENVRSINSFGKMGTPIYETVTFLSLYKLKMYFVKNALGKYTNIHHRWTNDTHQITVIKDV